MATSNSGLGTCLLEQYWGHAELFSRRSCMSPTCLPTPRFSLKLSIQEPRRVVVTSAGSAARTYNPTITSRALAVPLAVQRRLAPKAMRPPRRLLQRGANPAHVDVP